MKDQFVQQLTPAQETARLEALRRLQVLDSPAEEGYDEIVRRAAQICAAPIALISLVDEHRQWFKASIGLQQRQTAREHAFCAHALAGRGPLVVNDALSDPRFHSNPLVTGYPHIRFYAGAPLVTSDGHALGTVCVIDTTARDINPEQLQQLESLAQRVISMLEGHRLGSWLDDALEVGGVGLFSVDFETQTVYSTATCCKIFGLPEKSTYPASAFEALVLPEDRHLASIAQARRSSTASLNVEYRIARADTHQIRHICRNARQRLSVEGRASHLVGAVRDVTSEHEKTESEVTRPQQQELLVHTEGRNFVIELAAVQRAQTDPAAVMRLTAQAIGERLKASRAGFYRVLAGNAVQYSGGWSGSTLPIVSGVFDASTGGAAVVEHRASGIPLVFADSRHDMEGRLRALAAQGVLSGMMVPLRSVLHWHAGMYVECSEVRVWSVAEVVLVREVTELAWLAVERAEALVRLQGSVNRQTAQIVQEQADIRSEGTARGSAEAQVRQLQKMESVGMLAGGIAHDFNNMLAVIVGALNLMERKLNRGCTDLQRHIDSASDAARRAAALTSKLLSFSRKQPLDPRSIDANRLVAGMAEMLTRTLGEGIQLKVVQAAGLWTIKVDPGQLESVIVNLAVNSRDAMPDGGYLTIELGNISIDEAYATENEISAGHYVKISVTDTGKGMSSDVLEKAFDPFFTTKDVGKGTGLGLSQAFGFARQSGGHIKCYSEVGHGTTFNLYLPRAFGAEDAMEVQSSPRARRGTPEEVVLVVEDEARMRTISVEALRELGYTVLHASGGPEALAMIQAGQRISLLFTDIVMPEMSGRDLADRVRTILPDLPVVFTSGYTKNAVVHNGVLDPGTNFLPKPFSIDELEKKLAAALDGPAR